MYKFKFNVAKEDIDAHIKNGLTEKQRELFKNAKFIPYNVKINEDMDIEIMAVGALDFDEEIEENAEETETQE